MTLLERILSEKRALAIPLLLALLVNLLVYALVVYPLAGGRPASPTGRPAAAARCRRRSAIRGGPRAGGGQGAREEELATFYKQVLPPDYVAARRMTYARLPGAGEQDERPLRDAERPRSTRP